jgi:hypothetical protein
MIWSARLKKFFRSGFDLIQRARFPFPLLLFIVALGSFAVMLPFLGFYWDDWQAIFIYRLRGLSAFWPYFAYDRPFSAWTYIVTVPLFQTSPLGWQIYSLALRYLTALGFWLAFRGVWGRRREVDFIALIILVYPVFLQQPISVAYSQHWLCYALFAFSLSATVWSVRRPRLWWLVFPALAASALQVFTLEYFFGLEVFRGVLLLGLAMETEQRRSRGVLMALKQWAPYLFLLLVFVIWRFFIYDFAENNAPNQPLLLAELVKNPLDGLLRLVIHILQDLVFMLVNAWAGRLTPAVFEFTDRFNLLALAIGAQLAVVTGWYCARGCEEGEIENRKALQMGGFGLIAVLAGVFPVWAGDRQIIVGAYSDRFALAALPGLALLISAALVWLTPRRRVQAVLIAVLIGLSANIHLRVANDYRWIWIYQQRFFWQFAWRVPALQPGTAVLSDGEIFSRSSTYATAFGINLLYPRSSTPAPQVDTWFFSLGRTYTYDRAALLNGAVVSDKIRNVEFSTASANSILIDFQPVESDCMHVLRPEDAGDPLLPAAPRQLAVISNLSRILPVENPSPYRAEIFGSEPEHGWCYFYQKAELSRQQGDWDAVLRLADEAEAKGYNPGVSASNTAMEWRVFIEAYARAGRWEQAAQITRQALARQPDYLPMLCALWDRPELQSEQGAALGRELECSENLVTGFK